MEELSLLESVDLDRVSVVTLVVRVYVRAHAQAQIKAYAKGGWVSPTCLCSASDKAFRAAGSVRMDRDRRMEVLAVPP